LETKNVDNILTLQLANDGDIESFERWDLLVKNELQPSAQRFLENYLVQYLTYATRVPLDQEYIQQYLPKDYTPEIGEKLLSHLETANLNDEWSDQYLNHLIKKTLTILKQEYLPQGTYPSDTELLSSSHGTEIRGNTAEFVWGQLSKAINESQQITVAIAIKKPTPS